MTTTLTPSRTVEATVEAPPDAAIPMRRLVHAEWSKATDTRSARWLIGATAAVTVLVMLVPLLKSGIGDSREAYLYFAALALTTLLPVVSILTLTSEWTQHAVLTTFIQEPRRRRVIQAKIYVCLIMAGAAIAFGGLVTAGALTIASAAGRHVTADLATANIAGFVIFVLLNMLMGVAFGALLHNTASAISLFFVLPIAFTILGAAVSGVAWINPSTTFTWVQDGEWDGHVIKIVVTVLAWLVVPLVLGLVRTARREIKQPPLDDAGSVVVHTSHGTPLVASAQFEDDVVGGAFRHSGEGGQRCRGGLGRDAVGQ